MQKSIMAESQSMALIKAQRYKILDDFFGNVEILTEVLGYCNRKDSQEYFESALRKLTFKLNNTSILFNALKYEAEDEKKYCKDLQEDLLDTCSLCYKGLLQMKESFKQKELQKPFEFYLEMLKNPLVKDAKRLSLEKSTKPKNKNMADVEKSINDFLSKFAKADMDFQNNMKTKMMEELETRGDLQRTIASSVEQMTQKSQYISRNDLNGSVKRMHTLYNNGDDIGVEKILTEFCQSAENRYINPADCQDLLNEIRSMEQKYCKIKKDEKYTKNKDEYKNFFQKMEQLCQETCKMVDSYSKNI